jgi:hypothetical protein
MISASPVPEANRKVFVHSELYPLDISVGYPGIPVLTHFRRSLFDLVHVTKPPQILKFIRPAQHTPQYQCSLRTRLGLALYRVDRLMWPLKVAPIRRITRDAYCRINHASCELKNGSAFGVKDEGTPRVQYAYRSCLPFFRMRKFSPPYFLKD